MLAMFPAPYPGRHLSQPQMTSVSSQECSSFVSSRGSRRATSAVADIKVSSISLPDRWMRPSGRSESRITKTRLAPTSYGAEGHQRERSVLRETAAGVVWCRWRDPRFPRGFLVGPSCTLIAKPSTALAPESAISVQSLRALHEKRLPLLSIPSSLRSWLMVCTSRHVMSSFDFRR